MLSRSLLLFIALLAGCSYTPKDIQPITGVEPDKYIGTWYEIARLDHSFEQGLEQVTATYSKLDDGGIKVINRGYNPETKEWKEAEGKAYFIDNPGVGKLKVSFFGPFYGGYNIIDLDKTYYNYVMICGPNKSYFWILSRTPQLPYPIKAQLIARAKELGFETNKLIYVKQ